MYKNLLIFDEIRITVPMGLDPLANMMAIAADLGQLATLCSR